MAAIHTRNILKVYRSATPDQIRAGRDWYSSAHNLAWVMGRGDVWKGAGVISAYSPLTPWWRNQELAISSLFSGVARTDSLGNSVKAAQRILNGEYTLDVLKGDKTRAFACTIANNGMCDCVTVDSHAYSIAMGTHTFSKDVKMTRGIYKEIAISYRNAAKREGISPAQMQAITWVVWRDRNVNKAARKDIPKEVAA